MRIEVTAHPSSKEDKIEIDDQGIFHVYVTEPPVKGRANKAIINSLSRHFELNKPEVVILSGEKSRNKIIEVLNKP